MALVAEDGTGKANADSYVALTEADAYHADRGNAAWASAGQTNREAALRRATRYMIAAYRLRWDGTRGSMTQALDWPRYLVPMRDAPTGLGRWAAYYDPKSVPLAVRQACCELALLALDGDLNPPIGRANTVIHEKVGLLETEYAANAPFFTVYRDTDMMLAPLLKGAGNTAVVRG